MRVGIRHRGRRSRHAPPICCSAVRRVFARQPFDAQPGETDRRLRRSHRHGSGSDDAGDSGSARRRKDLRRRADDLPLVAAGRRVGVTAVSHKVIRNLLDAVLREAAVLGVVVKAAHKLARKPIRPARAQRSPPASARSSTTTKRCRALASGEVNVLGGTAWLWAREDAERASTCWSWTRRARCRSPACWRSRRPREPGAARRSAAAGTAAEGQPSRRRRRLRAGVPARRRTDDAGGSRTVPSGDVAAGAGDLRVHVRSVLRGQARSRSRPRTAALDRRRRVRRRRSVVGAGRPSRESERIAEEVEAIATSWRALLAPGARWIDEHDSERPIGPTDFRIVAPYNAQVNRLKERLDGLRRASRHRRSVPGAGGADRHLLDGRVLPRGGAARDGVPV